MALGTQTHHKVLRDLLTYQLRDLRAELHAAGQSRLGEPNPGAEVADRKDLASQRQSELLSEQTESRLREEASPV